MTTIFTTINWQTVTTRAREIYFQHRWLALPIGLSIYFLAGNTMSFEWDDHEIDITKYEATIRTWLYETTSELITPDEPRVNQSREILAENTPPNSEKELWNEYKAVPASQKKHTAQPKAQHTAQKTKMWKEEGKSKNNGKNSHLMNTYSNLGFTEKGAFKGTSKASIKKQKQLRYVERFAHVAQAEMEKFGIPASITLAQGLLESNVGESRLARKCNNHFGMKCFSKRCTKGHCMNFTDDSHKDFFRTYKTVWESFRAHSKLLQNKRYRKLYSLGKTDYKAWAHGLKKAGYATDKRYAQKLIGLIENLNLNKYDK